ncbi:MAG: hypothetical protein H6736_14230 [Alphaproteobacteria bacterium]|nr:hypothetical protein [Alphaproteobacteria bacterium]MCB9692964.1 hypothetical protein [Alphaproteobacteria bacterium]
MRTLVALGWGALLGLFCTTLPSPPSTPDAPPCPTDRVLTVPCVPDALPSPATDAREELPAPRAPDEPAASEAAERIEACLDDGAPVWVDCESWPCLLAGASPQGDGPTAGTCATEAIGRRGRLWRTVHDPDGHPWTVWSQMVEPDTTTATLARRQRLVSTLEEHVRFGLALSGP